MNQTIRIVTALLSFTASGLFAQSTTYNFESLNPGTLGGQDGWVASFSGGTQAYIANGTGVDTTKVATNDLVPDSYSQLIRPNNGSFSFWSFTGAETQAFIQFDFRKPTPDSSSEGSIFRFGTDVNHDGTTFFNEGLGLRYQDGKLGFDTAVNIGPSVSRASVGAGNFDDWFRLRLVMDFTANSGQGLGTLFYENLTRGDTTFTQLLSGSLALGNLAAGARPQNWDTVEITAQRGSYTDNLTVGVVPEPSTWAMVAGGIGFLAWRRRALAL